METETIEIKKSKSKFIRIPKGTFMMGSPENEPERYNDENLHEVTLTSDFWLGETACTQEFWLAVMGNNPSYFKGRNLPVENVSWDDVNNFMEKLNKLFNSAVFRLPTEAEWEYACRAGTKTPFSFGENITMDQVNFEGAYRKKPVPIKSLPPNPWGLYEMHGNVWEWCSDLYGDYDLENTVDPKGKANGVQRVMRGGCYFYEKRFVRSAARDAFITNMQGDFIGFRLARNIE